MKNKQRRHLVVSVLVGALVFTTTPLRSEATAAGGGPTEHELQMQLSNPVASLISVPIQNNFDFGAGPKGDGFAYRLNIQPVIPISISKDWNIISRTILPVVYQQNIVPHVNSSKVPPKVDYTTSQYGLSDTLQSFFFSPKAPVGGMILGAGPVFQIPTATDEVLGEEKWGVGPTAVVLIQKHGWTFGALANHVWSFAGDDGRREVNRTFLQPFVSYAFKTGTTLALNSESSYDWVRDQWSVPINASVKQLVKFGGQPVQFELGGRYFAEGPDNGPEWGLRFTVTMLFPTGGSHPSEHADGKSRTR